MVIDFQVAPLSISALGEPLAVSDMSANEGSLPRPILLAAPGTIPDLGPFVLGNHRLHVEQHFALWRVVHGMVGELGFHAVLLQLFENYSLVEGFASQAVWAME